MVPVTSLLIPIVGSAVIVFVASSIIHMVLPFHRNDFRMLPKEDEVMDALRGFNIPPGDYMMPCAGSPEGMKKPEYLDKMQKGPVALITVVPNGPPTLGTSLLLWFLYCLLVSFFAAYLTGRALTPGAHYLEVFRFVGTAAFMAYSFALLQNSIWTKRSWSSTLKSVADGFIYGLLSAGVFGWLWPR
ncbi:MAG: hypothetical protein AB1898_08410 [Acidobacteriota bacterium]